MGLPNFIFLMTTLSIGAGSEDESRGAFHFESFDVHVSGSWNSFKPLRLKSSVEKRIAPIWLHFPRQFTTVPAGQVQAAAQTSAVMEENLTITL